jgi:hypothetical protein
MKLHKPLRQSALTGGATDAIKNISKRRLEAHRALLGVSEVRGQPICPARVRVRGDELGATI